MPAFPADGKHIFSTFCSFAIDMARDMPRSLNEPVGFTVSFFTKIFSEIGIKGVKPSPRVTLSLIFGRTDAYLHSDSSFISMCKFVRVFSQS